MMWLITSRIGRWISAALAAVGILTGAYLMGARDARQRAAERALERKVDTLEQVRDNEREANQLDDESLADRISRPH